MYIASPSPISAQIKPDSRPLRCLLAAFAFLVSAVLSAQPTTITINGATEQLERNLRALVGIPNVSCETSQARLRRFIPGIRQSIDRAGRALGFYFMESSIEFTVEDDCWALGVNIEPGAPLIMSEVEVNIGSDANLFSSVLADLPIAAGDQLNQKLYEEIKTNLSTRAVEMGFFTARFERSQLLLDLQENSARASIDFNPG